jgi:hypothetical protein
MNKKKTIDNFLEELKKQSPNELDWEIEGQLGDILKNFAINCKKCGSSNIFVSWEKGYGGSSYTGYCEGQKLFKCLDCGNSASFWE